MAYDSPLGLYNNKFVLNSGSTGGRSANDELKVESIRNKLTGSPKLDHLKKENKIC
jgi:hypothetical protein